MEGKRDVIAWALALVVVLLLAFSAFAYIQTNGFLGFTLPGRDIQASQIADTLQTATAIQAQIQFQETLLAQTPQR